MSKDVEKDAVVAEVADASNPDAIKNETPSLPAPDSHPATPDLDTSPFPNQPTDPQRTYPEGGLAAWLTVLGGWAAMVGGLGLMVRIQRAQGVPLI